VLVDLSEGCTNAGGNCSHTNANLTNNAAFAELDGDTVVAPTQWSDLLAMVNSFAAGPGRYVDGGIWDETSYPEAYAIFGVQMRHVSLAVNEGEGGSWPGGFDIDSPTAGGGGSGSPFYTRQWRRRR
jgi:hypothetical protein